MVEFVAGEWRSGPVRVASSFSARLRGLVGTQGLGLLIRTTSVHGMGLRGPLRLVGLDRQLRVTRIGELEPWRLVVWPNVTWLLELPPTREAPPLGVRLRTSPSQTGG